MRKRKVEKTRTIVGRIRGTLHGPAYMSTEDGGQDLYIPADALRGAMDGDTVRASVCGVRKNGMPEAVVVSVDTRSRTRIVGMVQKGAVIPDERRLPTLTLLYARGEAHAADGTKVVAEITHYGDGVRPLLGRIVETLGRAGEPGVDVMSVIRRFGIREAFPAAARAAAARAPQRVREADLAGRADLRGELTFTIDGRGSKDFDDAVSISRLRNGNFELGVHIADVTAYVRASGALDREAQLRGTSVYFADRVLPMLPEELSNGICSLNAGADRLTLSCIMEVNEAGDVVRSRIVESVICSRHRFVYDDVSALLTWDGQRCELPGYDAERIAALQKRYADALEPLARLGELQAVLSARRIRRGSIDFDVPESEITLGRSGRAVGLGRAHRGIANRVIEECMLLCNETVAHTLHAINAPFLYRVHGAPDGDRLRELNAFLGTMGYAVKHAGDPSPKDIQAVLAAAAGTQEEGLISKLMLRAMQKARYDAACIGHFGLAAKEYCHFTSPIRRYPDLFIHRVIKLWLHGALSGAQREKLGALAKRLALGVSEAERTAMEAERCVDNLKKCEYMQGRIGESDTGVVSGVTANGVYVELPNTAEGFIRLSAFEDDYYVAEPKQYRITGREHGRVIRLGDQLRVTVQSVDLELAAIDFIPETRYHKQRIYNHGNGAAPRAAGVAYAPDQKRTKPQSKEKEEFASKRGGKRHATRKGRKATRTK